MWIVRIPDIYRFYQSIAREDMHEQLPSQSFDSINCDLSSLTVCKCIPVNGDLFSDSDTDYSNPDTLISDLSNVSVEDNCDFDPDTGNSYIEGSNSDILFSEHSDEMIVTLIHSAQWVLAIRMIQVLLPLSLL